MEQNQYCGYIFIDLFLFANESEICNYANDNTFYSANKNICDALRDLVPLDNFKKRIRIYYGPYFPAFGPE